MHRVTSFVTPGVLGWPKKVKAVSGYSSGCVFFFLLPTRNMDDNPTTIELDNAWDLLNEMATEDPRLQHALALVLADKDPGLSQLRNRENLLILL